MLILILSVAVVLTLWAAFFLNDYENNWILVSGFVATFGCSFIILWSVSFLFF